MPLKNHIYVLQSFFFGAVFISIIYVVKNALGYYEFNFAYLFLAYLILNLPTFYLHFSYFQENRGLGVSITRSQIEMTHNDCLRTILVDEIAQITTYCTPGRYKSRNLDYHFASFEAYCFSRVKLKTGEEIILTNLLINRLEKQISQLHGVRIKRESVLYPRLEMKDK